MVNIPMEIKKWANERLYWEKLALDKIISGKQFTKIDYDDILHFLLDEHGLAKEKKKKPELEYFNAIAEIEQSEKEDTRLIQISNLKNVNALANGQTLTFGTELTAVYGYNASGKSGYARVLGCAGFTRGDKNIYPDINKPSSKEPMTADIEISRNGEIETIAYEIGSQCPSLSSFSIFDNASVGIHLTKSNKYHFSPSTLSYLTRLAEVTEKLRERLVAHIKEHNQRKDISHLFSGKSRVRELVSNINPDKTLEKLNELAELKPEEKEKIDTLEYKIAELKVIKTSERIDILAQIILDIEDLAELLIDLERKLCDETVKKVYESIQSYHRYEEESTRLSLEHFKSDVFKQVGTKEWHLFVKYAKALAEAEEAERDSYPQPTDHCLLCRQPLSQDAHKLITDIWEYLGSKAKISMKEAEDVLADSKHEFSALNFDFFNKQSVTYRHLEEHEKRLIPQVECYIQACKERCFTLIDIVSSLEPIDVPDIPEPPRKELMVLVKRLKEERRSIQKENIPDKINKFEDELVELKHREILKMNLPKIQEEVEKQIWLKKANAIHLSTRPITMKYDQLFKQVVTQQYVDKFQEIIQELGCSLSVSIQTTSRKSIAHKEIVLEKNPRSRAYGVPPDKILSDGEQHAVAFADFLTEVSLDELNNGIIMDDPVTSLDLEWKMAIASMLVKQSKNRQVIIFTHDLPFLCDLDRISKIHKVDIKTHLIRRDGDNTPGYICLDESPAKEEGFKSSHLALEHYKRAKSALPTEQENYLLLGFDALRQSYEAFIIFELLQKVVKRFGREVSPGRLKDIVWDEEFVNQIIENYGNISGYIGGHLHADELPKPSCERLIREIEKYDELRKEFKSIRKAKIQK